MKKMMVLHKGDAKVMAERGEQKLNVPIPESGEGGLTAGGLMGGTKFNDWTMMRQAKRVPQCQPTGRTVTAISAPPKEDAHADPRNTGNWFSFDLLLILFVVAKEGQAVRVTPPPGRVAFRPQDAARPMSEGCQLANLASHRKHAPDYLEKDRMALRAKLGY
jgi:hypothetical protein